MIPSQFKIDHVPEPLSRSFEGLDVVVGSLRHSTGTRVLEIIEKPGFLSSQGFCYRGKRLDPRLHGIFDPDLKETFPPLQIITAPEKVQSFPGFARPPHAQCGRSPCR